MTSHRYFSAKEIALVNTIREITEQIGEREKKGQDSEQLYRQLEKSLTNYEKLRQNQEGN